jgi:oligoribonuclease
VVVTDPQLTLRVEGPVFAVHQSDAVLDGMDNWNKGTHGKSGLIDRVRPPRWTKAAAEAAGDRLSEAVRAQGQEPHVRQQRSARTAASWPTTCPAWKPSSTTATWT